MPVEIFSACCGVVMETRPETRDKEEKVPSQSASMKEGPDGREAAARRQDRWGVTAATGIGDGVGFGLGWGMESECWRVVKMGESTGNREMCGWNWRG